jgi:hypothetical protein
MASRAGVSRGGYSVAANGMIVEQAQVVTTHNLATLAHAVGVTPAGGWPALVPRAFAVVVRLAGRLDRHPRPLPTIKDIAYAWRHLIFYLSLPATGDPRPLIDRLHTDLAAAPSTVQELLNPAVVGLSYLARGGTFTDGLTPAGGRRLLGWTTGQHWMTRPGRQV